MNTTLADVARAVGCSSATVSRVINNIGPVSTETREAVFRAMKEVNYVPRPSLTPATDNGRPAEKGSALIEVILYCDMPYERLSVEDSKLKFGPLSNCPPEERLAETNRLSNSFYHSIVDGIVLEAPHWSYKTALVPRSDLVDPQFLADLNRTDKTGVLLVGMYGPHLQQFVQSCAHPLVLVDLVVEGHAPVVTFDNVKGIEQAFDHLYALGHRKIGCVAGPREIVAYHERCTAFRYKMAEKNLHVNESWIYTGEQHVAPTQAWAQKILGKNRPTAFICANDWMAIAVVRAAQEAGISVPKQLSVVGFDDNEVSSLVTPALTTLRVPTYEIGRQAVQQLELQIKLSNRRSRHGVCLRLAPELIVRESTAPAK
jgi:DNA-binding LacI/PurR family transcriptional regulator